MDNPTKHCIVCGKEFAPARPWQKYDGPGCGVIARNRRRYDKIREAVKLLDRYKAHKNSS